MLNFTIVRTQQFVGDNLCCAGFLLHHQRLRVSIFFAATHKVHRCLWNSVSCAGKFAVVSVGTILAYLERGPFQGEAKQQLQEGTMELQAKTSVTEPLLVRLVPKILRDRGVTTTVTDEIVSNVRDSLYLGRCMEKKPPKTALTQVNTSFEFIVPEWHERVASFGAHGLREGLGHERSAFQVPELPPPFERVADEKEHWREDQRITGQAPDAEGPRRLQIGVVRHTSGSTS